MNRRYYFSLRYAFIFLLGIGISFNSASYAQQEEAPDDRSLPLQDIQRFSTTIGEIKSYYVEDVNDSKLFENAIRGMLEGLDPHSDYLDEEEFAELRNHTSGEFGGLGIEVGMEDGYLRVVSPIDDTPAYKAGIKAGDLIVKLGDKPIKGMTLREAVNIMRGPKGTPVELTIIRKNETRLLKFKVVREIIEIKSVKSRLLEEGYGYIRISQFQAPTGKNLNNAIKQMQKQSRAGLKGLVLDLRNNPGGLLDSAVEVSDSFLDSNKLGKNDLIVYTKGRLPSASLEVKATPGDLINGVPMVILINEGSASGSEIVAGALQDHKRAVIMGTQSFGKGSVQTVLPLDDKSAIKLTTALYYTPNGRSIQATGIKPDIYITDLHVAESPEQDNLMLALLKEADLDNHLANGNSKDKKSENSDTAPALSTAQGEVLDPESKKPLAEVDYQLFEALNLLKGLSIASTH